MLLFWILMWLGSAILRHTPSGASCSQLSSRCCRFLQLRSGSASRWHACYSLTCIVRFLLPAPLPQTIRGFFSRSACLPRVGLVCHGSYRLLRAAAATFTVMSRVSSAPLFAAIPTPATPNPYEPVEKRCVGGWPAPSAMLTTHRRPNLQSDAIRVWIMALGARHPPSFPASFNSRLVEFDGRQPDDPSASPHRGRPAGAPVRSR